MEVRSQLPATAVLSPGKQPPVPTGKEAGWAPELVWTLTKRKIPCPTKNETLVVQHIA